MIPNLVSSPRPIIVLYSLESLLHVSGIQNATAPLKLDELRNNVQHILPVGVGAPVFFDVMGSAIQAVPSILPSDPSLKLCRLEESASG